jgi:hypothetical protein
VTLRRERCVVRSSRYVARADPQVVVNRVMGAEHFGPDILEGANSGYCAVPRTKFVLVTAAAEQALAMPKSATLAAPASVSSTLWGFMSR